jgi:hypothetical protein
VDTAHGVVRGHRRRLPGLVGDLLQPGNQASRGGAGRNLNSVTGLPPTYLCVDELGGVRFFLVAQHIGLSAQQASP